MVPPSPLVVANASPQAAGESFVHAALESSGISGLLKEARRYPQCADRVTHSPCGPDFLRLATHAKSVLRTARSDQGVFRCDDRSCRVRLFVTSQNISEL